MKQNFLALVNEVKATGIVAILSNASNAEAFKDAWQKFADENPELLKKASEWGAEFKQTEAEPFFEEGEAVENPMEVVVAIRIAGNEVSEADVFEYYGDLVNALNDLETDFAATVAKCVDENYIYEIKVEHLFPYDDDENEEEAETDELFANTLHPYTQALFASIPDFKKKERKVSLSGELPVYTDEFKGCVFHTRCPHACDKCRQCAPKMKEVKPGHRVACHLIADKA